MIARSMHTRLAMRIAILAILAALAVAAAACRDEARGASSDSQPAVLPSMMPAQASNADATPPPVPYSAITPVTVARARASWPHDTTAYTQGLVVSGGRLLESTGREGRSELREVARTSGRVLHRTRLAPTDFGEGLAESAGRLYQLTWQGGRGYVYDARSLARVDSFTFAGEGWGLASDGARLWMSDGSAALRVIDPAGFREERRVPVREGDKSVWMLNELEFVRGELWANVYETDFIARIDPATGQVIGWVNIGGLLTPAERADVSRRGGVANGIAYDPSRDVVLVTGKLWPRSFELARRDIVAAGTRP